MGDYLNYIDTNYQPDKNDLICDFFVKAHSADNLNNTIGGVAAESSIGTWTKTATERAYMLKLAAKVFSIKKVGKDSANVRIAYPNDLFELGNVPDIMSSVAGNVFGMKDVVGLRLNDITYPKNIVKSFPGPKYGIAGIRKITGVLNRPLIGTIVKPKIGLNTKDHARVCYESWIGGCDIVKDDENLSSQKFNRFEDRLRETVKLKEKAEKLTGEKKIYMINITAETNEMLRRAKLVEKSGNEYAMVDIVTVGWSALQTLRNANFNLVLHAHRAGHAAFDKSVEHGINMKVIARTARMIGVDQLHIGAALGKMFETPEETIENRNMLVDDFYGVKKVFPVASGGLEPLMAPDLYKIFGKDVIMQFGGGIHGHPAGTSAGATAARQALDSALKNIPLAEYAKTHPELEQAIEKWG